MQSIRQLGAFWVLVVFGSIAGAQEAVTPTPPQRSGNAVAEAEKQARTSMENEMKNNQGLGSSSNAEQPPVYPKSSMPDVRDAYHSTNKVGAAKNSKAPKKKYHGQKPTGSEVLDSLSGSSWIPEYETDSATNKK